MHTSNYQTFLKQLQKRVPDYLATAKANVDAMQAAYSYGASVVDQKSSIKIQAVSHGRLKLTWQADKSGRIQLPIVTYRQSRLIVNGKKLTRFKRSLVSSPTVVQQPGAKHCLLKLCCSIMAQFINRYFTAELAGLGA